MLQHIDHFAKANVANQQGKKWRWEDLPYRSEWLPLFKQEQAALAAMAGTDRDLWKCREELSDETYFLLVPHGRVLAPGVSQLGLQGRGWRATLVDNGRGRVEPAHRIERQ